MALSLNKGNECYKNGEYEKAVNCYENAVIIYGPKAVYENNLAAALLKVGKCVCCSCSPVVTLTTMDVDSRRQKPRHHLLSSATPSSSKRATVVPLLGRRWDLIARLCSVSLFGPTPATL